MAPSSLAVPQAFSIFRVQHLGSGARIQRNCGSGARIQRNCGSGARIQRKTPHHLGDSSSICALHCCTIDNRHLSSVSCSVAYAMYIQADSPNFNILYRPCRDFLSQITSVSRSLFCDRESSCWNRRLSASVSKRLAVIDMTQPWLLHP